ncbi:hypothetical protein [Pelagibius sp.]|uniref:hypothetical protein n=1 Tax=Pelagibius sp. TaxID=1931238 RepID=UPI00260A0CAD|nr:hypothetical protein [Pelagibius sp.]
MSAIVGGGGGAYRLLDQRELSGSTNVVDFTDLPISVYEHFEVRFSRLVPVSDNVGLSMRMRVVGGGSFANGGFDYEFTSAAHTSANPNYSGVGNNGSGQIQLAGALGAAATESANGIVRIANLASTTKFKVVSAEVFFVNASDQATRYDTVGHFQGSAAAVDALRFFATSGNMAAGLFQLFGVKGR